MRIEIAPWQCAIGKDCIEAHQNFVAAARRLYADQVVWSAPARRIEWQGCERVIQHLLREAGGMFEPEFTPLRRSQTEHNLIDEFAVRFRYLGEGIERAPIASGDLVELNRVRVLEMNACQCVRETCVETWTVLQAAARK